MIARDLAQMAADAATARQHQAQPFGSLLEVIAAIKAAHGIDAGAAFDLGLRLAISVPAAWPDASLDTAPAHPALDGDD